MNQMKKLREERNFSMKEAATKLNLPYTTYINYEKGYREPNSEMLIKIADLFGVTVDYLIGNANDPFSHSDNVGMSGEINEQGKEKQRSQIGEHCDDPGIFRIQRARKDMTPAERQRMMNILKASFENYFSDDYVEDDLDE